jgi:hypothetical protein
MARNSGVKPRSIGQTIHATAIGTTGIFDERDGEALKTGRKAGHRSRRPFFAEVNPGLTVNFLASCTILAKGAQRR